MTKNNKEELKELSEKEKRKLVFEEFVKNLNKNKGDGTIIKASQLEPVEFISTGSLSLDFGLGGGIPRGRFSIITGAKHTGKSFIAYKTLAEYQKIDSRPAIILDFEKNAEKNWIEKMGVDLDNVWVIQPEHMNQGIDMIFEFIKNHLTGLVIIDSIASGSVKAEMERSAEEEERAVGARMWNKAFRKLQGALNSKVNGKTSNCSIILINQDRLNIGTVSFTVQPGGKGKDYSSSLTISLRHNDDLIKHGKVYLAGKSSEDIFPVGVETKYVVEKNKVAGTYNRMGLFRIIFSGEDAGNYDLNWEIWYFAKRFKIINVASNGYIDMQGLSENLRGQEQFLEKINEDIDLKNKIISKIKEKMFL